MTKEKALAILATCYRHVCEDKVFGDAEVTWTKGPHEKDDDNAWEDVVAGSYVSSDGVPPCIYMEEDGLSFDSSRSEIMSLGLRGTYSRNDSSKEVHEDYDSEELSNEDYD